MVARGDLGLNLDIADLPEVQKKLIFICNQYSRPVITATQMLESMTNNVMPTRAEADDVFTAIEEGTDAVMLSEETAIGVYPLKALKMLQHIISKYNYSKVPPNKYRIITERDAIVNAAVDLSTKAKINKMIVVTPHGKSALNIARYHLPVDIIGITDKPYILARLIFSRGVIPILFEDLKNVEEKVKQIAKQYKIKKAILISGLSASENASESIRIVKF
jgi:Pyruvate kinase